MFLKQNLFYNIYYVNILRAIVVLKNNLLTNIMDGFKNINDNKKNANSLKHGTW